MSFDEEYIDPHGECAAEIARLKEEVRAAYLRGLEDAQKAREENQRLRVQQEKLNQYADSLEAAIITMKEALESIGDPTAGWSHEERIHIAQRALASPGDKG